MISAIFAEATARRPGARESKRSALESCRAEGRRIGLLLEREGPEATREWVKRTLAIYRRAVLDRSHFASLPEYRRGYLASCADFRRWLRMNPQ